MPPPNPKRGRWQAARRQHVTPMHQPYRAPAPDVHARPAPTLEESGHYQALRDHWLVAWLRRLFTR